MVSELMKSAIADGVFPGAVILVCKDDAVIFFEAYGYANIFSKRLMTKDTIFDLASLTKPLGTTLAIIRLIEMGKLSIDMQIGNILPPFHGTDKANITIRHLLGHNSGFPAHRLYYERLWELPVDKRRNALREYLVQEMLEYPTGEKVIYSDLGFMVLAWVAEYISGLRLDDFLNKEVYHPLGLENIFFVDVGSSIHPFIKGKKYAATEYCPNQNIFLEGIVHDDNARAAGGIEGHAGLFGCALDISALLKELMAAYYGRSSINLFSADILKVFFKRQSDTGRALGFDSPSLENSSCGSFFSISSVGHLGFTGTSFWMDLERGFIVILLTNRVHPTRKNEKIKIFRPSIHNAIMKTILSL